MAITGLIGVRGATLKADGTYENAFHIGDAMTANISITMAEGALYANNRRKEYKQKFDAGTIELGVDDLLDAVQSRMFGHGTKNITVDATTVAVNVAKEDDKAPNLGVGFYQTVTRDSVDMYRVIILRNVQFSEPTDNAQTAENNITMNGRTTTGQIMSDGTTREWKYDLTVETEAEATALLDAVLGEVA